MITSTELRLGNLVTQNGVTGSIYSIEGAQPMSDKRFSDKDLITLFDGGLLTVPIDEVFAIPLTEEVFLQFDQVVKDGEWLSIGHHDARYCFRYRDWTGTSAGNWAVYIEYTDSGDPNFNGVKLPIAFDIIWVHQLQNIFFALTGIELQLLK